MSRRYGQVWRTLWRDRRFRACSQPAKLIYLALLTGPCTTSLPGLVEADALMLASITGLGVKVVAEAIGELERGGLVAADTDSTLVAITDEPSAEDLVKSYKIVLGWWSNFCELQASAFRDQHVARLARAVDMTVAGKAATDKYGAVPSMAEAWARTFGTIKPPGDTPPDTLWDTPSHRVSDTPSDTLTPPPSIPATATATASASRNSDSVRTDFAPSAPDGAPASARGAGDVGDLFEDDPTAPKASGKKKSNPLPFTVQAASDAVATTSAGRYTPAPVAATYRPNIAALIRAGHALDDFAVLGAYLAAGGDAFPPDKGPSWLASAKAGEAMVRALAWHASGRPVVGKAEPATRKSAGYSDWKSPPRYQGMAPMGGPTKAGDG